MVAWPVDEVAARMVGVHNLFDGRVVRHDTHEGLTWLRTGELTLSCSLANRFPVGSRVRWMIPNNGVRLRAITHGGLPASHNRVCIVVQTLLMLGDEARMTASLPGLAEVLHLQVPTGLVRELRLQPGSSTDVVLREDRLHIMGRVDG